MEESTCAEVINMIDAIIALAKDCRRNAKLATQTNSGSTNDLFASMLDTQFLARTLSEQAHDLVAIVDKTTADVCNRRKTELCATAVKIEYDNPWRSL